MDWVVQLSADVLMVVLGNTALMMRVAFGFFVVCALLSLFGFAALVLEMRKKSLKDDVY